MIKKWTNPRGNNCELQMFGYNSVDYYDKKFQNTNWQRFDTNKDSANFGIWINPPQLKILIFADDGQVLTSCKDRSLFQEELDNMCEVYRSHQTP